MPSTACDDVSVTKLLGTVIGGDYPNYAGHRAVVGPVEITGQTWCVELCHFYNIETRYDGGNVKISTDGGSTWSLITPQAGYPNTANSDPECVPSEPVFTGDSNAFIRDCFDLSGYKGRSVLIGFDFGSDASVGYPGWYIKWVKFGASETPTEARKWGTIKTMFDE